MEIHKNIFNVGTCARLISEFDNLPTGRHQEKGWDVKSIFGNVTINNNGESIVEKGTHTELYTFVVDRLPNRFHRNIIWMQMTRYTAGAYLSEHIDSYANDTLTVLLTDKFSGGDTIIDSVVAHMSMGDGVYFCGSRSKHMVTPVERGIRYALNIWFKPYNSTSLF